MIGITGFLDLSVIRYYRDKRVRETPIHLGPLKRANLNHLTTFVSLTTTICTPEIRRCQWETTEKFAMKLLLMHTLTLSSD
jgi:hypothetical protein